MDKLIFSCALALFVSGCNHLEKPVSEENNIIIKNALEMGISYEVIHYVAMRESRMICNAYNKKSGASGPLQITLGSARSFGFNGTSQQLRNCKDGLHYGLLHVKMCVNKYGQNPKKVARCHESPGTAWNYR